MLVTLFTFKSHLSEHSEKWSGFCPELTLAQFPEIGFLASNSWIGVKDNSTELGQRS